MKALPLYKQIIRDLLEKIQNGELRPGDRIPSEHDLSTDYMVSSITSKNALAELTDKGYIIRIKGKGSFVNTLENLMKIPEYCRTSYHRTAMCSKTIGLILPSMKTGIDQRFLDAIEMELSQTEYILALVITREDQEVESEAIRKLKDQGASGLIIFPTEHELYNENILRLNMEEFPFVLVDRYLRGIRTSCVCTDNYGSTLEAVSGLFDSGAGYPLFISPDSRNTVTEDRLEGFRAALLQKEMFATPKNMCMLPLSITDPLEKKERISRCLKENPEIDGLFCANMEMASYVDALLADAPDGTRYRVAAFDYPNDGRISYIEQNIPEIAQTCVTNLIDQIHGRNEHTCMVVPARYVKR